MRDPGLGEAIAKSTLYIRSFFRKDQVDLLVRFGLACSARFRLRQN
jgi:hypothetical protein